MAGAKQIPEKQREAVKTRLRSGTSVDDAYSFAQEQGFQISRATIGVWRREVEAARAAGSGMVHPTPPPIAPDPPPAAAAEASELPTLAQLAAEVARLRAEVDRLRALVSGGAIPLPSITAEQAAMAALQVLTLLAQDPNIDPRVRVQAVDKLPELARLLLQLQEPTDEDDGLEKLS